MNNQKKKIIIISGIGIIILAIVLIFVFSGKKTELTSPGEINKVGEKTTIKNIAGKVKYVGLDSIGLITEEGEELLLKIPKEGASFFRQAKQEDGSVSLEKIGILDIAANQEADVQYNSQTNKVSVIAIK